MSLSLFAVTKSPSSPLQKCVERVEALKASAQNLLIRQPLFCPTLEHAVYAHTFDPLKFGVVQISVMNHFANFGDGFIRDGETLGECLKRAAVAMVREFSVQHVERNGFRNGLSSGREHEFCFGINELGNQPR